MRQGDMHDPVFNVLAEQLKVPLLQIARLSEPLAAGVPQQIAVISNQALRLVDAYVQSSTQAGLMLEPLNTSAVLYDVAHILDPLAKQAGATIVIDRQGKAVPVMAHQESLKTMLTLLGASLIEANDSEQASSQLVLGSHRSAKGTVVGAFSSQLIISQHALQLARVLYGQASQTIPVLGQTGSANLAVADRISGQMSAPLKAYRHRSLSGIGSLFAPSYQLQLVA